MQDTPHPVHGWHRRPPFSLPAYRSQVAGSRRPARPRAEASPGKSCDGRDGGQGASLDRACPAARTCRPWAKGKPRPRPSQPIPDLLAGNLHKLGPGSPGTPRCSGHESLLTESAPPPPHPPPSPDQSALYWGWSSVFRAFLT